MNHNCCKCGVPLIVGENITQYRIDHRGYICRSCQREYDREYRREHAQERREYNQKYNQEHRERHRERMREWIHRTGRQQPMSKNRQCSSFLGVYVAERVLSHVFKHVERMPTNNPGFDFICGGGHRIDVKSSCRHVHEHWADQWVFTINKNPIAEYFLCLAFDNRESLNPEHVWIIPAADVNDRVGVGISETTLGKWDEYALDVSKVSKCCNIIKEWN